MIQWFPPNFTSSPLHTRIHKAHALTTSSYSFPASFSAARPDRSLKPPPDSDISTTVSAGSFSASRIRSNGRVAPKNRGAIVQWSEWCSAHKQRQGFGIRGLISLVVVHSRCGMWIGDRTSTHRLSHTHNTHTLSLT